METLGFKKIEGENLGTEKINPFQMIGKDWMLVTAGDEKGWNTMTASWGGIGNLWNKPVAFIFVRPDRYTHQFIENNERVTLSFYDPIYREALRICGSKSGRDTDKVAEAGLIPFELESGAMTFAQSRLTIDGCKIYQAEIGEDGFNDWSIFEHWYGSGVEPHTMYIIEIEKLYVPVK